MFRFRVFGTKKICVSKNLSIPCKLAAAGVLLVMALAGWRFYDIQGMRLENIRLLWLVIATY